MKFCDRPFTNVYLASEGEVWPCGWMHYVIGNVYEQDLEEIWNGEAAKTARQTILDGTFAYCRKISCPFCERGELEDISEDEVQERAVPSDTPLYMTIANDRICNIACTTCRTSLYCPEAGERDKIDGVLEKILPLAELTETLDTNGQGEFLANPSFVRFLEKLRPVKKNFGIQFETNGILFDEAHWEKFSHLGGYHMEVTVTINSLKRDVYRYLSGGFDYLERVLKNLRFMSQLRKEGKINKLRVTMVVQDSNFWEVPEYIHTFSHSEEFMVDEILMKPLYKWFKMERETYWFKNILNPFHPYHKAYLKMLDDDCWKDPKVYDWGCHNIREAQLHPLSQEKTFNRLLREIYDNDKGLMPAAFMKNRLKQLGVHRIGVYGENDFTDTLLRLLQEAGADVVFQMTRYEDEDGEIPTISMPNFKPDSVDAILLLEFYDMQNRINNLRSLKFTGPILTLEDLIEGKGQ